MPSSRIAVVYRSRSSFVDQDISILEEEHDVEPVPWRGKRSLVHVARAVHRADLVMSWFAADHAYVAGIFARLMNRPHLVVAAGVDVGYEPAIGYGRFTQGRWRQHMTRSALEGADVVAAVSDFARQRAEMFSRPRHIEVVPNGVDPKRFSPALHKEPLIVTMGAVTSQGIPLKGLDTFARATVGLEPARAVVVGPADAKTESQLRQMNPGLEVAGPLAHEDVARLLARATVFAQLSYVESFGVGVCEAMASGCIPVVSDRGALPATVGKVGYIVPHGDVEATAQAIRWALRTGLDARKRMESRAHVLASFTRDLRAQRLNELVRMLLEPMA